MNKNNNLGRFILVIIIVAWSLIEIYPPKSGDLTQEFTNRAQGKDAVFTNILNTAAAFEKNGTNNAYVALKAAAGTNAFAKYFPFYAAAAANEIDPNGYVLGRLQREAAGKIKLGIDLQGGTSFLVQMDTSKLINVETRTNSQGQAENITNSADVSGALSQAIDVLTKRLNPLGVTEPLIQSASGNRILIELPGLSQADKEIARKQITKPAYLEFRMVLDNSEQVLHSGDPIPLGYEEKKHSSLNAKGKPEIEDVLVKKKPENGLYGDIIKSAFVGHDTMGGPAIEFELTPDGAKRFGEVTVANVGHRMAIILDGELYSAPNIESPIETGSGQITGNYSTDEAYRLANVMQNPLKAPLQIVYESDVGATLGQDSINSGIRASIYSVIFVAGFMLIYYLIAGLAANVALITNVIILLGVMCAVGNTFTLPGIAGGVLTVGMAVDANVLIYERIREELAKGKSLRGAIDAGYARAFGTIFDSHVTTLISSVILIIFGSGEIKGFGVTLSIGVAASLFTALVVTRLIFNFLVDRNWISSLPMMHIIRSAKIDFMRFAAPLAVATTIFAVVTPITMGVVQGKKLFGIDFRGGDSTTFSFAQRVDVKDIRDALPEVERDGAQIQYQKGDSAETLSVITSAGSSTNVVPILEAKFPQAKLTVVGQQQVGGTIGQEMQQAAVIACFWALMGILVYVAFRYEFLFAAAAVLAVLHDVLLTIGCFCIANYLSGGGKQFSATVVAAVLTIIGFSINDKIVIFDRIREQLKLGVRGSFRDIINLSLNQTLSRTIITSGTVFLATLSLFLFGGGAINDFALVFLIGIITGTYSSICIASVLIHWWHKGQRPTIGASQVTVQGAPQAAKAVKV